MECEHVWIENTITHDNGGYMIMKFCHKCMDVNGYGFLNKDHETAYLNSLYDTPDDMIK
jgi:hypothetical protein